MLEGLQWTGKRWGCGVGGLGVISASGLLVGQHGCDPGGRGSAHCPFHCPSSQAMHHRHAQPSMPLLDPLNSSCSPGAVVVLSEYLPSGNHHACRNPTAHLLGVRQRLRATVQVSLTRHLREAGVNKPNRLGATGRLQLSMKDMLRRRNCPHGRHAATYTEPCCSRLLTQRYFTTFLKFTAADWRMLRSMGVAVSWARKGQEKCVRPPERAWGWQACQRPLRSTPPSAL